MATETLHHRTKNDATDDNNDIKKSKQNPKAGMARKGLKTLIIAIAFPVTLHLTMLIGAHRSSTSLALFPYPWILHVLSLGSGALMGLCAWLVWVEGGFHQRPMGLGLFLSYLFFSLMWDWAVMGTGSPWAGLVASLGMLGTLGGCCGVFKKANPISGDLVKLCLIWAGSAVLLNVKLLLW